MHTLYLHKKNHDSGLMEYTYSFDEHTYSPANQIVTRLFRQMILSVEETLNELEVEYIDTHMAKLVGLRRSLEILELLGAKKSQIHENKKGEFVLSRSFRAALSEEALQYFKRIQDMEELSVYRLLSGDQLKIEVYFVKTIRAYFTPAEEEKFLKFLKEERIPVKVI